MSEVKENNNVEFQESEEGKDFLEVFITKSMHKAMGKSLDLFRISEISDRAMDQIRRSLKDYYNELIVFMIDTLKEKEYIKKNTEAK